MQEIRQARTVRQRWDYSGGSAALATILTHHYGDKTSEAVIITSILKASDPAKIRGRGGFSLLDLKRFVESRGYKGSAFTNLNLNELTGLKIPAIVPLQKEDLEHFVVFRGVRGNRVVMSDPAFGTVTMQIPGFMDMWKGGLAFIVQHRDNAQPPTGGLEPKPEELLIPDGGAVSRAITMGARPLTRPGS
jgi:predicted double-glycine peptidase